MKDGGPAFPHVVLYDEKPVAHEQGMSLRDYFAAKAMHAELNTAGAFKEPAEALSEEAERNGRSIEQQIAVNAYSLADAMLERRLEKL